MQVNFFPIDYVSIFNNKLPLRFWSTWIFANIFINTNLGPGVYGSHLILTLTLLYWVSRQFSCKHFAKFAWILLTVAMLTVWSLLAGDVQNPRFIIELAKILFLVISTIALIDLFEQNHIKGIAIALPVFVTLVVVFTWMNGQWDYYDRELHRFGVPAFGTPNTTAYVLALSLILVHYQLSSVVKKGIQLPLYGLLLILQTTILLTQSRGGILIYLAGMTLIQGKKTLYGVLMTTILSIGLTIALKPYPADVSSAFSHRFNIYSDVQHYGGTGRFTIWNRVLSSVLDSPSRMLFGYGPGAIHFNMAGSSSLIQSAHSAFLDILHSYGFAGLAILATGIVFLSTRVIKRQDNKHLHRLKLSLFIALLLGFGLDSYPLTGQLIWFTPLILAIIACEDVPVRDIFLSHGNNDFPAKETT